MEDATTITERWKIEDITVLPNCVSVQELTHRYDRLSSEVNAYSTHGEGAEATVPEPTTTEGNRLIEILGALRLVCSLLLSLSSSMRIKMQSRQCEILESTTRRAWILEKLLCDYGGTCTETSNNIENQHHHHSENPFVSVQIIQVTASLSGVNDDAVLEWKYDDVCVDDDDVENEDINRIENDSNIIPISMMTHEELIQEEELLLQMANTPIPTSSNDTIILHAMNIHDKNNNTMQDALRQGWGESQYIQMQLKFKNNESYSKQPD
jgi:hypothetical protein